MSLYEGSVNTLISVPDIVDGAGPRVIDQDYEVFHISPESGFHEFDSTGAFLGYKKIPREEG